MTTKRTKAPEQDQAEYRWLTPSDVAKKLGLGDSSAVRALIRDGHLRPPGVMDVSRSKRPRYRISPEAVERFIRASEERVAGE